MPAAVEVRESAIEGLGVFALRAFAEDERIRTFALVREITEDAPLRPGERREHCTYPDDRVFLVGPPDRHFNHSCDPNAYKRFVGDAIHVHARRPIETGAEITLDYLINTSHGDRWPCHCGAARCRGFAAAGFFELPLDVQREYLPLLAPWFVAKHAERVEALRAANPRSRAAPAADR